jgi:hypothetical protein
MGRTLLSVAVAVELKANARVARALLPAAFDCDGEASGHREERHPRLLPHLHFHF